MTPTIFENLLARYKKSDRPAKIDSFISRFANHSLIIPAVLLYLSRYAIDELFFLLAKYIQDSHEPSTSELLFTACFIVLILFTVFSFLIRGQIQAFIGKHKKQWRIITIAMYFIVTLVLRYTKVDIEVLFLLGRIKYALLFLFFTSLFPLSSLQLPHLNKRLKIGIFKVLENNKLCLLISLLIVMTGLPIRFEDFFHDIDGVHKFRQAMIACNSYFMIHERYWMASRLFNTNIEQIIFEWPIYQALIAFLSQMFDANLVHVGRLVNIIIFVVNSALIVKVLSLLKEGRFVIIITLVIYVFSPLNTFFNRALVPDNLGFVFTLTSFYSLLLFEKTRHNKWFALGLILAIVPCWIKAMIYLPFAIAICFMYAFEYRTRVFTKAYPYLYCILILFWVISYKTTTNLINTGGFSSLPWEWDWYVGAFEQRLNIDYYKIFLHRFSSNIGTPVLIPFFIAGVVSVFTKKYKSKERLLMLSLGAGSIIAMLFFFNVSWRHDYYQIPYVFIYAYLCALGIEYISDYFKTPIIALLVIALFIWQSVGVYKYLRHEEDGKLNLIETGQWVQSETGENDFVYFFATNDWNPIFHWHLKRFGYNFELDKMSDASFLEIWKKNQGYDRYLLYIPKPVMEEKPEEIAKGIKRVKANLILENKLGNLYSLDKLL